MKHSRFGALVAFPLLCAAILVPASALAQTAQCDAARMDSAPATEWMTENGWRYGSPEEAAMGYQRLLKGQSPWPDWFHPEVSVLMPGARFQMAMSAGQGNTQPGGFGTYDYLTSVEEVRDYLAVLPAWKKDIDRIVTFEVKAPLLVSVGPIGPQVDTIGCKLYAGRFTQIQMLVSPADRMNFLTFIDQRSIS